MDRIEHIKVEQLFAPSAMEIRGQQRRLSDSQFEQLSLMCRQMAVFYPHQELCTETVEGYLCEFERMAVEHGLSRVESGFVALRSKPGQRFFPHPSELGEEIERQIEDERATRQNQLASDRSKRQRQADIEDFWNEILPDRMRRFGWTEEEALRRFPSFRGTRPATVLGTQRDNVVPMPSDRMRAAAGDRDDAA